ncbi:predicted protein [Nematostella vectensis]|uniref:C2H2-type domain-containing protein n=1 Tax=Nematostella vectensis TaxID=45351 RepID=A7SY13_NEMVE|nr:predicted protein [Nematostella vectensis]|eukprot:XP_001623505.1 predicted protein [Nematostella vectensis]
MSEFVVSSSFVWAFRPVKRLILPDDPFFEEGNIYCNILRKQIDLSDDIDDLLESGCSGFKCSIPGCAEVFRSISRCLVESCPDKFSSENERKDHLVQFHHYPADFRFNRPSRTQRKLLNRMPANICFGRGSARVFQRGSFSKKSGKKSKQRNTYKPGAQVDEETFSLFQEEHPTIRLSFNVEKCMTGLCRDCPNWAGTDVLEEGMGWYQWERFEKSIPGKKGESDKTKKKVEKVAMSGSIDDAISELEEKIPAFLNHGAVDGVGGTVKRAVGSAVSTRKVPVVSDAKAFVDVATKTCKLATNIVLVSSQDIKAGFACFDLDASAIPGIAKMHCVEPNRDGTVTMRNFSSQEQKKTVTLYDTTSDVDEDTSSGEDVEVESSSGELDSDEGSGNASPQSYIHLGLPYSISQLLTATTVPYELPMYLRSHIEAVLSCYIQFNGDGIISLEDLQEVSGRGTNPRDNWLSNFVIDSYLKLVSSQASQVKALSWEFLEKSSD